MLNKLDQRPCITDVSPEIPDDVTRLLPARDLCRCQFSVQEQEESVRFVVRNDAWIVEWHEALAVIS